MPPDSDNWEISQAIQLSLALADAGVDFIDVSSGALMAAQKVVSGPGYQVPFAAAIKKALEDTRKGTKTKVGAVGMITGGKQAEKILRKGGADLVLVGREFQRNPGLVWDWAGELGVGVEVRAAKQIGGGFGQRGNGGVRGGAAAAKR